MVCGLIGRVRSLWLLAGLLLAAVSPLASPANAQVPAVVAEIPYDPPVDVIGDALAGLTLQKAVLLMRHGVRPPTSTAKFQIYADAPFPSDWGVPDGYLTAPGATLVSTVGTFDRAAYAVQGLLPASGCPRPGDLFVWANNADERTEATGQALVQGLFPGCGLQAGFSASSTADPLFTAPYPEDTTALSNAVLAHIGGSFQPIQTGAAALLSDLNTVLGCCSTALCQSAVGAPACTIASLPYAITPSGNTLSFTGGLLTGSSLAEIFELEYANGFTGTDVAFGRTDEAGVRSLMRLYTAKYRLFDRTPALARATGSNLALQMLDAIEGGAGKPVPGGPPAGRVTIFVGNDTTQSAVGGLLNLDWHQQSFNTDDMPPGGSLGFELLKDRAGRFFVRPVFITMTLDQMHAGKPLRLTNVPLYEALALPGCEYQGGRLCSLSRFVTIVTASIQPSATGPISYQ
jgi:4-phytase/acid phosphatase